MNNLPSQISQAQRLQKDKDIKKNIRKKQDHMLRRMLIVSPVSKLKQAKLSLNNKVKESLCKKPTSETHKPAKTRQPTPKMSYKKIPQALHNSDVPLDSLCYQNTSLKVTSPQFVENLSGDIFKYMRSIESVYQAKHNYMDSNVNLDKRKRAK